ncbi:MAG: metallophosphoesterase family protein, partial [Ruminococcus sp.]|nr:metallophosphoesterase family protein [Candidatus Copronaster equi]
GGISVKKISKRLLSVILCMAVLFGGSVMASNAADAQDEVTRVSCTLNGDSKTSRGFCWYTRTKTRTDIQIIKSSEFNGSFDGATLYSNGSSYKFRKLFCHKIVATELEPGTAYTYRVGDKDLNIWSEKGTFVTDDGDNSFSFITIADVQASSDENFAQAAETLKGAFATCPEAEFMTNLGDFVNDDTNDEWNWYFKNFAFANMNTTFAPVAGNHDGNITNKLNINVFNSMFNLSNPNTDSNTNWVNGVYYSYDYGNAHFAVLNTNDMYPMTQSQRNWLINDMKSSDADWKIILMHRAAYAEGKNINKPDTIIMRDVLLPLFDELDIDLVYAGHDHTYYRSYQVEGDKVVKDVNYVTESYKGEQTTFAVNPKGSVHVLPATAGTKRYTVHNAINPIPESCAFRLSTRDMGGCFTTTTIDGDKLIIKSYLVDDDTQAISLIDQYAIKKDLGQAVAEESTLATDNASNIGNYINNVVNALADMLYKYVFVLLPQAIKNAIVK